MCVLQVTQTGVLRYIICEVRRQANQIFETLSTYLTFTFAKLDGSVDRIVGVSTVGINIWNGGKHIKIQNPSTQTIESNKPQLNEAANRQVDKSLLLL